MADAKPIASLSAGLLARKGAARPAMRRQLPIGGFGQAAVAHHDDLGWNDMGYDVDPVTPGADTPRAFDHGLTPMGRDDAAGLSHREMESALDRHPAEVAPIVPKVAVPGPVASPAIEQRQAIEASLNVTPLPEPAPTHQPLPTHQPMSTADSAPVRRLAVPRAPRVKPGTRGCYAFTLRLDPERHMRLRLAAATHNLSAQQLLVQLLDQHLAKNPSEGSGR